LNRKEAQPSLRIDDFLSEKTQMAKRMTPKTNSGGDEQNAAPRRAARARSKKTNGSTPDFEPAVAAADDSRRINEELPNIPEPGDVADQAQRSESMASEPSEEDIRLRAYHRYLERGGGHGRHFDDWLAAEDELRRKRAAG
jgi:DUF2934 family protein